MKTLSNHRAAITAIVIGHSFSDRNIAVSASVDKTCIVWDYANGDALHTFLLPLSPLSLALDPADRAVYAGYEDGSVQLIDFYSKGGLIQPLHDPTLQSTPTQPPPPDRWSASHHSASPILCLQVTYDGTSLLTGHNDGKIHVWDIAAGKYDKQLADFAVPITNIIMLKPSGFPEMSKPAVKLHNVVKPRYESFVDGDHGLSSATIPTKYTFVAQFTSSLPLPFSPDATSFHQELHHPSFPTALLEESLAELSSRKIYDFTTDSAELLNLRAQNSTLSSQLGVVEERHRRAAATVLEQKKEEWRRQKDEDIKTARKKRRRLRKMKISEVARQKEMGETVDDEDEDMNERRKDEEDLSSSTDEMTESD